LFLQKYDPGLVLLLDPNIFAEMYGFSEGLMIWVKEMKEYESFQAWAPAMVIKYITSTRS
jgi:hypothetical protein